MDKTPEASAVRESVDDLARKVVSALERCALTFVSCGIAQLVLDQQYLRQLVKYSRAAVNAKRVKSARRRRYWRRIFEIHEAKATHRSHIVLSRAKFAPGGAIQKPGDTIL